MSKPFIGILGIERLVTMADVTSIEHPTLKVPYDVLNKKFRVAQKTLDREACQVTSAVSELEKVLFTDNRSASNISSLLGGVVEKLTNFKRKAEEATQDETECGRVVKRRVDHLKEHDSLSPSVVAEWKRTRLDRLLVEYLLRAGCYSTATKLASARGTEGLTNLDVFLVAREVEQSLACRDTSKCLSWCHDNRSKLRKLNSSLEFNVRMQEFIELIKNDRTIEAIKHARKYLNCHDPAHVPSVQRCMALIAFPASTDVSPYNELLSDVRWDELIEQFRAENLKLYQLSSQSAFSVVVQAGLSALKTPHCYRENFWKQKLKDKNSQERSPNDVDHFCKKGATGHNPDCPVCQPALNALASPLPFAHCSQSRLVCHISGEQLNENNQPLMLPNGHVYGQKALQQMADENNGSIVCPRTRQTFNISEAEKVFVM
ncbi:LOW QUALITY PROTEIN: E3 ubiquitin-protein transferase MAEA-like [Macrobrachium nipponense]|uniref:LOW QUALITY PROTEIN: E3 ubiquitin-protein transferase MAEA-like n=1 Tax=Macrobrachium nipponense TaxID=159736 RepID=UPI0030C88AE8